MWLLESWAKVFCRIPLGRVPVMNRFKFTIKTLFILTFWCGVGFIVFTVANKEETPAPRITPEESADQKARIQSMMGKVVKTPSQGNSSVDDIDMHYEIVASSTGRLFYRGEMCPENCEHYVLGYTWAKELGITQADACQKVQYNPRLKSPAYSQGCTQATIDNNLK